MNCPPISTTIDIPAARVSGKITVNGTSIAENAYDRGSISLVRTSGGVVIDQGQLTSLSPTDGGYSSLVVPGTYDVVYTFFAGSAVPVNAAATLRSGLIVGTSPLTLDLDVPATAVTLIAKVKGTAMTATTPFHLGGLALVSATGDTAPLMNMAAARGAYSALVAPGTYDLVYAGDQLGTDLPLNAAATIQSGIVIGTSGVSLTADVPATKVSIALTVNGAAPSIPAGLVIKLALRTAAGDSVQLVPGSTSTNTLSAFVVPGTYDLDYSLSSVADSHNPGTRIRSGIVVGSAPVSMTVDVTETPVSCTLTVDGASLGGASNMVRVYLLGSAGETIDLFTDGSSTLVLPGTYDLVYRGDIVASDGLPSNQYTPLRSGVVVGASALTLPIDIPAVTVSGAVTVNGAPFDSHATGAAFLLLRDTAGGTITFSGLMPSYTAVVIPGTYDLTYRMIDEGPTLPENTLATVKRGIIIGPPSPFPLDVDIRAVSLPTTATVNGAPVVDLMDHARGVLQLYSADGDVAGFANVAAQPDGLPPALVVPGQYDLYYRTYNSSPSLPINNHGYLGCVTVR